MADGGENRTEKATPRRKEKAREEGQVANSRELASVAVLLAATGVFLFGAAWMLGSIEELARSLFLMVGHFRITHDSLFRLVAECSIRTMWILAPMMLCLLVAGVGANVAQVGLQATFKPLVPNLDRISPIKGFMKLVSVNALVDLVKSLAKIIIVSVIAYLVFRKFLAQILGVGLLSVREILGLVGTISFKILWDTTIVLTALAILDFVYQKYAYEKSLKMTLQEVKDEHKNYEGDPHVKGRQRSIQREMALRRMMSEVPKADVVLTNPTHVAVALKYDPAKTDAPVVTAKGAGFIAQKIREKAEEHRVPVLERPPLARELYGTVKLGAKIPVALYEAVAGILAFIYNLQGRRAR